LRPLASSARFVPCFPRSCGASFLISSLVVACHTASLPNKQTQLVLLSSRRAALAGARLTKAFSVAQIRVADECYLGDAPLPRRRPHSARGLSLQRIDW